MTSSPLVKELMVCNPIVCGMDTTVREAIDIMESHSIGSVIVVDKFTREPLNIITHKDIISAIYHSMLDSRVSELIELLEKRKLITIHQNIPVIEAIRIFEEKGIEHLPVVNDENVLVGIITGTDILKGLPRFAFIDPLTGLENRRVLDYLQHKYSRQRAKDIYVLMIDLDSFKRINDTYGHIFGDKVLKAVAQAVVESVRTYDNVIRFGGEEVVVVLHRVDEEQALEIAERIRRSIEEMRFEEHPDIKVTASIGLAPYNGDLMRSVNDADRAMYRAKREGKNRIFLFK